MNSKGLLKLFSLLGFVAFAAVSCWATAESLHLLLPNWPSILCWIVTIGFYVVASYGTKMIVDSLNQSIYVEKRRAKFVGGILLALFFWIVCSFPTNTHTFFYRSAIVDVVIDDIAATRTYLQNLASDAKGESEVKRVQDSVSAIVNAQLIALEGEIDNLANPGFGDRAKSHLAKIAQTLQVAQIPTLSYTGNTPSQIKSLKEQYRKTIVEMLERRKMEIARQMTNVQALEYKPEAEERLRELETMSAKITDMANAKKIDEDLINQTDMELKKSYATIKNYQHFVEIKPEDKEVYLSERPVTKTSRMLSVFDVWKDFLEGKYAGRGIIFWVILSFLVDIAAFIFFDLAFKKRESL